TAAGAVAESIYSGLKGRPANGSLASRLALLREIFLALLALAFQRFQPFRRGAPAGVDFAVGANVFGLQLDAFVGTLAASGRAASDHLVEVAAGGGRIGAHLGKQAAFHLVLLCRDRLLRARDQFVEFGNRKTINVRELGRHGRPFYVRSVRNIA